MVFIICVVVMSRKENLIYELHTRKGTWKILCVSLIFGKLESKIVNKQLRWCWWTKRLLLCSFLLLLLLICIVCHVTSFYGLSVSGFKNWSYSLARTLHWIAGQVTVWFFVFDSKPEDCWQPIWIQSQPSSIFGLFPKNYICQGNPPSRNSF